LLPLLLLLLLLLLQPVLVEMLLLGQGVLLVLPQEGWLPLMQPGRSHW
jgi:hypothetical protein